MSVRTWAPRVTVAAVAERDGRFLLVEEQTPEGVRINQPAGHLDQNETLVAAVARETLEETGWHFTATHLLGVYMSRYVSSRNGEPITYLRFAFTGTLGAHDAQRTLDHGILRCLWLSDAELHAQQARHRSVLVARCVDDFRRGLRHPLDLIYTHPDAVSAR